MFYAKGIRILLELQKSNGQIRKWIFFKDINENLWIIRQNEMTSQKVNI